MMVDVIQQKKRKLKKSLQELMFLSWKMGKELLPAQESLSLHP